MKAPEIRTLSPAGFQPGGAPPALAGGVAEINLRFKEFSMRIVITLALFITLTACNTAAHGSAADAVTDAVANGEMTLPTAANEVVPGNDGLLAFYPGVTEDNFNPAQANGWRGYGLESWEYNSLSSIPVYNEDGSLAAFAAYFDVNQQYRVNCASADAIVGDSSGWCEFSDGPWTLTHDDGDGSCADGTDVVVAWDLYGEPYRPDGSQLGSLDCD